MLATVVGRFVDQFDSCPWGGVVGHTTSATRLVRQPGPAQGLYTEEERRRRDQSPWTMVQGVLAPAQFAVFLVSLALVARFLLTGNGETVALASIVLKTVVLYAIMITGAVWERQVFGRYLFAPAFYWEDAVSMIVLALHTAYLVALLSGALDSHRLMLLALAGYGTYVVNAAQFVLKFRTARREQPRWAAGARRMEASA